MNLTEIRTDYDELLIMALEIRDIISVTKDACAYNDLYEYSTTLSNAYNKQDIFIEKLEDLSYKLTFK